jgi:hypothetical protein
LNKVHELNEEGLLLAFGIGYGCNDESVSVGMLSLAEGT